MQIMKGVPIPPISARHSEYAFNRMEVGDCVEVDTIRAYTACRVYAHRTGKKFEYRRVEDEHPKRLIWRVE